MPPRERSIDRARRLGRQSLVRTGDEIRAARLGSGLTLRAVGEATGVSTSELSRIELGQAPNVPYRTLVIISAAVGLDLPLRTFSAGNPLRDRAHLAVTARFRSLLPSAIRWTAEVPIGRPGDQRAWDGMIAGRGWQVPVEVETRLHDIQGLVRRIRLKLRDDRREIVVLVVAGTRHNRQVVRLVRDDLRADFPIRSAPALRMLAVGTAPTGSAVVFV
jgi:transcriptional regulator with XRE-family HTH domain